ncbi:ABC transporter ATP-binding protein [Flavicella sediminum]|uniref:ABC transporter ATP-binding protein n=1 Tax=Flavicella sediminum TaxID=2585141 RepID=UPI0011207C20|nr:ABC transporter ATP-binding protein [Flavicella sediminum]
MKALQYLNKYFHKYRYRLIAGIFICILSRYLAVKVPEIVKNSINIADDYVSGLVTEEVLRSELLANIGIILGLAILSGFFTFLMRQTIIVTSRLIEFDLKNEIFLQYERLSLNFYKKNRTGDLMNRISEDVGKVRMYFGPAVMYTVNMLVLFTVAIFKMIKIDVTLTLYTLIPFPLLSIAVFVLSKFIHKRSTIVQEYLSKLTTFGQEVFSGINVIKSYTTEAQTIADFNELSEISKEKNIELYKVQAFFFPMMILLIGISNLIVLYVGGMQYINGIISIGTIAEFIMYVNMLTWPVAIVGWVTSTIQQAEASQKRINEFLEHTPEIVSGTNLVENIQGNIEFKNVSLTYDDTNITALKNINFSIKKGETVAFLGKTGSGKSTILSLISRLYDTSSGSVIIDGVDTKDHDLANLRDNIGVVPQDPFLFSDSIANNIRFGDENADQEKIEAAAKDAVIHDNIAGFKNGYETVLGERGITVSGGQKQRISIARAIIKNPRILIFDDCLSAVDTETEEQILKNLIRITKDKTTIIVSHRVSSAKNADKIIILDEGEILQQGTHNQLVNKEGYYQELYKQQLLEKES